VSAGKLRVRRRTGRNGLGSKLSVSPTSMGGGAGRRRMQAFWLKFADSWRSVAFQQCVPVASIEA
jgi:hypothetical protein